MDLEGTTNVLTVTRAQGVSDGDVPADRSTALPGVALGHLAVDDGRGHQRTARRDCSSILRIVDVALVLLAALIAFNSTSHQPGRTGPRAGDDVRVRPPDARGAGDRGGRERAHRSGRARSSASAPGRLVLSWIVTRMLPEVVPDVGVVDHLAWTTVGAGAAARRASPSASRRCSASVGLARMDIPSTLRVME